MGGRFARGSADCPLPLRLGEQLPALTPTDSMAGGAGAGRGRRAGERHGLSSRLRLAGGSQPRARHLPDSAVADLGSASIRAARGHLGTPAGFGDRRVGRRRRQRHLRRRIAARAVVARAGLHGCHGHQHAHLGRCPGRAPRGDPGARRVHLHRLARAQDAAHRAQAAPWFGDSNRRAPGGAGRTGRKADPSPGGLQHHWVA